MKEKVLKKEYDLDFDERIGDVKNITLISLIILSAIIMVISYNRSLYFLSDYDGVSSIIFMLVAFSSVLSAIGYFLYGSIKNKKYTQTIILLVVVVISIVLLIVDLIQYKNWFSLNRKYQQMIKNLDPISLRKEQLDKLTTVDLKISTISFINYFIVIIFTLIYTALEGKNKYKED